MPAQAFLHLVLVKINAVLRQPAWDNITVQQHDVYTIHCKEPGGKKTGRAGSNNCDKEIPRASLNQLIFSLKGCFHRLRIFFYY
jgi:hypothetical protein